MGTDWLVPHVMKGNDNGELLKLNHKKLLLLRCCALREASCPVSRTLDSTHFSRLQMAGNRHPVERPGAGEVGLQAKGSSSPRWDASGGHSSASALTISSE